MWLRREGCRVDSAIRCDGGSPKEGHTPVWVRADFTPGHRLDRSDGRTCPTGHRAGDRPHGPAALPWPHIELTHGRHHCGSRCGRHHDLLRQASTPIGQTDGREHDPYRSGGTEPSASGARGRAHADESRDRRWRGGHPKRTLRRRSPVLRFLTIRRQNWPGSESHEVSHMSVDSGQIHTRRSSGRRDSDKPAGPRSVPRRLSCLTKTQASLMASACGPT
jgi:hypothetical protein